jgi:hypothetical protein
LMGEGLKLETLLNEFSLREIEAIGSRKGIAWQCEMLLQDQAEAKCIPRRPTFPIRAIIATRGLARLNFRGAKAARARARPEQLSSFR